MKNDHRLGWPPALLAMDPDPRKSQRTPPKPPVSAADERARAALDVKLTKRLPYASAPVPASTSKPDYIDVLIHNVWWHKGGKPPHVGWWNAVAEDFARGSPKNGPENFSYWNGHEWTMATHINEWTPDYKPSPRNNQACVVWREVQP